jgi:hypothetical protein
MNNERYNQIIDEAYENYITQIRIEFEKWCERNPHTLVNYREDTKELFLKSIKKDTHWFTGEKKFSEKWGLKIEERELTQSERVKLLQEAWKNNGIKPTHEEVSTLWVEYNNLMTKYNVPTKLITVTYKDEKIEVYE